MRPRVIEGMLSDAGFKQTNGNSFAEWLAAHDAALLAAQPSPETAWREGYYTGKRDYAGSITSGRSITSPNPYGPEGEKR